MRLLSTLTGFSSYRQPGIWSGATGAPGEMVFITWKRWESLSSLSLLSDLGERSKLQWNPGLSKRYWSVMKRRLMFLSRRRSGKYGHRPSQRQCSESLGASYCKIGCDAKQVLRTVGWLKSSIDTVLIYHGLPLLAAVPMKARKMKRIILCFSRSSFLVGLCVRSARSCLEYCLCFASSGLHMTR